MLIDDSQQVESLPLEEWGHKDQLNDVEAVSPTYQQSFSINGNAQGRTRRQKI